MYDRDDPAEREVEPMDDDTVRLSEDDEVLWDAAPEMLALLREFTHPLFPITSEEYVAWTARVQAVLNETKDWPGGGV